MYKNSAKLLIFFPGGNECKGQNTCPYYFWNDMSFIGRSTWKSQDIDFSQNGRQLKTENYYDNPL